MKMHKTAKKPVAMAITLALGFSLAGCMTGGNDAVRGLESVNQPVVERTSFAIDLQTGAGGLPFAEQRKLTEWFEAMDLRYGDRVSIDDPLGSATTREAIAGIAAQHGLLLSEVAPVTEGFVDPGKARVIVTRSTASVPDCPNWSHHSSTNLANKSWAGFGCSINGNLAAMIADPEHLLHGAQGTGETVVMSSTKAIETYRKATPSGEKGLKQNATN